MLSEQARIARSAVMLGLETLSRLAGEDPAEMRTVANEIEKKVVVFDDEVTYAEDLAAGR